MTHRRPAAIARARAALGAAIAALLLGAAAPGPAADPSAAGDRPVRLQVRTLEYADTVADGHPVELNRVMTITATAPRRVYAGARVVVSGVAQVGPGPRARTRPVRLLEHSLSGWRVLARRSTARTGAFRFEVAAGPRARTRVFEVLAPRFDGLAAARTARLFVKVVHPSGASPMSSAPVSDQAPAGLPGDWSFLIADGVRWNPCTAIRWVYNPQGGYTGSLADVQQALARLAARTGLTFQYVGATTYVHRAGTTFPSGVDLAVAWSDETQVPALRGAVAGVGGGSAQSTARGEDVAWRMVTGYVVLDRRHTLRHGFDASGSVTWGQVMLHEGLHALGLGHASGAEQLMHASVSSLNHRFGAGDLTGMARIGSAHGCL